jgi:ABC-2 type transport system permease protein
MMATADTIKEKGKKVFQTLFVDKPDQYTGNRKKGLHALYKKELVDYFRSIRFILVLLLIVITGIASVVSAGSAIRDSVSSYSSSSTYTFLSIYTTQGTNNMPSMLWFLSFLGPIVGLALGFDAINGERSRRTLSRLVAQPIYRDTVINGKFLAGVTIISIMIVSLGILVGGLGIMLTGLPPTAEEIGRLLIFIIYTIAYMSLWLAISLMFSLLFQHAATSALSGIALWLFFAIFLGILAGIIANTVAPVASTDSANYAQTLLANDSWNMGISRISPTTLYNESASVILNPNQNALGIVWTALVQSGLNYNMLPLGQSLLLVWPHLTVLIALNILVFGISYICFMRQEIRA